MEDGGDMAFIGTLGEVIERLNPATSLTAVVVTDVVVAVIEITVTSSPAVVTDDSHHVFRMKKA